MPASQTHAMKRHLKDTHIEPSFDGELGAICENNHVTVYLGGEEKKS